MATKHDPEKNTSKGKQKNLQEEQTIAKLDDSPSVRRLLSYYELSLTEAMPAPLFGADQRFQLDIYNDMHELTSQLVAPTLDHLSQHLGFVNHAGYEAIKDLDLEDVWRQRLLDSALQEGKSELSKYLRYLRPLLMERQIYFYCTTPLALVKTEVATGEFVPDKGRRPLCALPMSVPAAELYGCSPERIQELAPQVAWLIPMLVIYRKVKATDQLLLSLDGWEALLTPQQSERMHTAFVKHAPYMVNEQVTQLLLPKKSTQRA